MFHKFKQLFFSKFLLIPFLSFVFASTVKSQGLNPIYPWNAELRAGVVFPTGDLAETVNIGTDIGVKIGYSLRERLMIRADVETELYSGSTGFENTQLWHYSGGFEYMFTDKGLTRWRLSANAGLGASTLTFEDASKLSENHFSLNYGFKFGRGINDNLDWFVSVMGRTVFANPENNAGYSTFNTIPITFGLNHRFNSNDKSILDKMKQPPN